MKESCQNSSDIRIVYRLISVVFGTVCMHPYTLATHVALGCDIA